MINWYTAKVEENYVAYQQAIESGAIKEALHFFHEMKNYEKCIQVATR